MLTSTCPRLNTAGLAGSGVGVGGRGVSLGLGVALGSGVSCGGGVALGVAGVGVSLSIAV
jgi:hypothetical protein